VTTIATDGKVIAADTMTTRPGGFREPGHYKKMHVVDAPGGVRWLVAVAGDMSMVEPLKRWVVDGATAADIPFRDDRHADWHLWVFKPEGLFEAMASAPRLCPCHCPNAIGSGARFAIGAFAMGATPRQAVEVASRFDIYTGGEVEVLDIADVLGLPKTRISGDVTPLTPKIRAAE
jgi:hypothetical protein